MKVLFIGGTGIISSACAIRAVEKGFDLTLLNRGQSLRTPPAEAHILQGDIRDQHSIRSALANLNFDIVVDWIAYTPDDVQRDLDLFSGKAGQYVFISSASAYQTPPANLPIRESTPLDNPVWEYSRNKIACEELLLQGYRKYHLPFTIVRPSHTYDRCYVPLEGGYTVIDRMLRGKPVIVHGDGTSIWTLTHHADFAKGFVGLLGNSHALGEIFHITSDEWLTWNLIYQILGEAAGVQPKLVHIPSDLISAYDSHIGDSLLGDKCHSAIFDNSKIKQIVPEFSATIPFSRGAEEIITWHRADPARQKIDPAFNDLCERILANYQKAWPR
ncbi:MAG: NAD-dependent dehydratase [Anaerolinea sp.]|nr:NAD-dependent dehydratase [Anaerolinea sp.]